MRDRLGGPYDFLWISQILHAYSEKECVVLLRKARKAATPGGRVAVQEFLLDESGAFPPGPAFFSVHMVAVTEGGKAYTAREIASLFRERLPGRRRGGPLPPGDGSSPEGGAFVKGMVGATGFEPVTSTV